MSGSQGTQILVVDNDRESRHLYTVLLKGLGANVMTATSVEEALEILGWLLPNILICEMRCCGESIDTLTEKLSEMKAGGDHIPTIAITTWITDSLAQILDASFEGYLMKPIDLDQLVSLIRNFASGRRSKPLPYRMGLKIKLKSKCKKLASVKSVNTFTAITL